MRRDSWGTALNSHPHTIPPQYHPPLVKALHARERQQQGVEGLWHNLLNAGRREQLHK